MSMVSEKQCSRCREVKSSEVFGMRRGTKDGLQPYCFSCRQEYQRKYHRKKKQPTLEEMVQAIEGAPRSESEIERRNRYLAAHRGKKKVQCAHPGCETNINRWQASLCMMHESEANEAKWSKKLARADK